MQERLRLRSAVTRVVADKTCSPEDALGAIRSAEESVPEAEDEKRALGEWLDWAYTGRFAIDPLRVHELTLEDLLRITGHPIVSMLHLTDLAAGGERAKAARRALLTLILLDK